MSKHFQSAREKPSKHDPPPPYSSLDLSTSTKEPSASFADKIGLLTNQGNNPTILNIIIIVVLTTANPNTKDLVLSKSTIATLSIDHDAVLKPLKGGLKRQDPGRAAEWENLDIFLLRELIQHVVANQDNPNNTYKAWLPTCRAVRPCYRGLGKGWWYGCTIGVARVVANLPKLERMRREETGTAGEKSYAEFQALWTQTFAAKWVNDLGGGGE